ncbi:MAG: hypothetical protein ACI87E_003536 [Mariniblastus sp.]|jgi:hypothetical protein
MRLGNIFLRIVGVGVWIVVGLWHACCVADEPWVRHVIDDSLQGADGVRLGDFNHDGLLDVVTGWEESGIVRLYLNPGPSKSKLPWPCTTVGEGKSPEDAVPFDVDNDGTLEIVSCHEGKLKQVLVHKFVDLNSADGISKTEPQLAPILQRSNWNTTPVSQLDGQMWMFASPIKIRNGLRGLVLGSKGNNATLTLLIQPHSDSSEIAKWTVVKLRDCGWIMSIQNIDMDHDGDLDIVFSDRKSKSRAVAWLEQPNENAIGMQWAEHAIGATDTEPMFIDATSSRILVATRSMSWSEFRKGNLGVWIETKHDNPIDVPLGKAIRSLTADTVVLTANTKSDNSKTNQPGIWLKRSGGPWRPIGETNECKFDRMELIDLDGDGDLDVMTCEERQQLGVVWYENPGVK